jgi:hypothetical protein
MNCIELEEGATGLGIASIEPGTREAELIASISARMASFCGRDDWGPSASRTEYRDGGLTCVAVDVWPITSITSIHDDPDHAWASDTALDAGDYFASYDDNGVIYSEAGTFNHGKQNLKIIYVGGYADEKSVPSEIKRACIEQLKYDYIRSSASRGINIAGAATAADEALLPAVQAALKRWRRVEAFA